MLSQIAWYPTSASEWPIRGWKGILTPHKIRLFFDPNFLIMNLYTGKLLNNKKGFFCHKTKVTKFIN